MREILFRGKRTDNGEWVEGYVDCNSTTKLCFIRTPNSIYTGVNMIIPETVGQYTGLTDKNGTKIFEGDIVRYPDSAFYAEYEDGYNEGFVDWCEETMCFYFTNRWSVEMEDFDVVDGKIMGVEVIGNIHDNPELLEVSDNA